eukprot:1952217-Prymnesium_polylepis.1
MDDEALVQQLQERLRPARGKAPNRDLLLAAIALARDHDLPPTSAFELHGIPAGGSRSHVL